MPGRGVPLPALREERLRAALTQEELGERAGVGRATIARLENGDSAAVTTARRLARALGLLPAELMGVEPPAPARRAAETRARYRVARSPRPERSEDGEGAEKKAVAA